MNTSSIVTLNVGGTKFETQKSTLTIYPGTFFQGLIDSNNESHISLTEMESYFDLSFII
jgi:hypothetical protein